MIDKYVEVIFDSKRKSAFLTNVLASKLIKILLEYIMHIVLKQCNCTNVNFTKVKA